MLVHGWMMMMMSDEEYHNKLDEYECDTWEGRKCI